jgi:hypothetical protein
MRASLGTVVFLALASTSSALADATEARCDIYPAGSDHTDKMIGCTFSQRQGYVTITRQDGVTHRLTPANDQPAVYRDQHGSEVRREHGLGDQGLIFRFPDESVYVYWNTAALHPPSEDDNPTAPFSTPDYDATTLLRCRAVDATEFSNCPAGILRMDGGQASIVVQSRAGEQFIPTCTRCLWPQSRAADRNRSGKKTAALHAPPFLVAAFSARLNQRLATAVPCCA